MSARAEAKEGRPKTGDGAEQARLRSRILEQLFGLHNRSRRVISEHRHRRKLRDREVSDRSRRGLDWTNFFLAAIRRDGGETCTSWNYRNVVRGIFESRSRGERVRCCLSQCRPSASPFPLTPSPHG